MADLVRGKNPSQRTLPEEVAEFILAHETGWSLDKIRTMHYRDRRAFNITSQFSYKAKVNAMAQPKMF